MKITVNQSQLSKIKSAISDSFADVAASLDTKFIEVIESDTEFADLGFNGQDIVDTGRFRDSQVVQETRVGDFVAVHWHWNPADPETGYHYAPALYSGFHAYGKKWIPGRPWTDRAVQHTDPFKLFVKGVKARL